jgi:hypothetical protein
MPVESHVPGVHPLAGRPDPEINGKFVLERYAAESARSMRRRHYESSSMT